MRRLKLTRDRLFRQACLLGEVEKLLLTDISPIERARLERKKTKLDAFFTPPRVSEANKKWRRPLLSTAWRIWCKNSSLVFPAFLAHPEIRTIIESDGAPKHWQEDPLDAARQIRAFLKGYGIQFALGRKGRTRKS